MPPEEADRERRKNISEDLMGLAGYDLNIESAPNRTKKKKKVFIWLPKSPTFRTAVAGVTAASVAGCAVTVDAIHQTWAMTLGRVDRWLSVQNLELRNAVLAAIVFGLVWIIAASARGVRSRLAVGSIVSLLGLAVISTGVWAYAGYQRDAEAQRLDDTFVKLKWITYEPTEKDPSKANAKPPSLEHMTQELKVLHDDGNFNGLLTFDFSEDLIKAAVAARFEKVIVGIHIERPEESGGKVQKPQQAMDQIAAFEKSNPRNIVAGYCLGHNTSLRVPLEELWSWMDKLRELTGKPVTTTFPLSSYLGPRGEKVRKTGDFYMPDVNAGWQEQCSPELAIERTRRALDQLAELSDKPVLLKMVSYPSAGGPGLTPENQKRFYSSLTRDVYLPHGCQISVWSGYDVPFKHYEKDQEDQGSQTQPTTQKNSHQWAASEEHVGLITAPKYDEHGNLIAPGEKKPAFKIVSGEHWPINDRP